MRLHIAGAALSAAFAATATAQTPARTAASTGPVGTWRGTSTCLVRPSACNDEVVVYRITRMNAADSLSLDARKIVGGQEQEMGVLGCRMASPSGQLTCVIPRGVWLFRARDDSLTGELRLPDSTRFREVPAIRAPQRYRVIRFTSSARNSIE